MNMRSGRFLAMLLVGLVVVPILAIGMDAVVGPCRADRTPGSVASLGAFLGASVP